MKNIQQMFGSIILIALIIAGIYFVSKWSELRNTELRNRAINDCMKDSYSIQPGTFSGAVYKLCVEDKGYKSNIQ